MIVPPPGAADAILNVDHSNLADFNPESYGAALAEVVGSRKPRLCPRLPVIESRRPRWPRKWRRMPNSICRK